LNCLIRAPRWASALQGLGMRAAAPLSPSPLPPPQVYFVGEGEGGGRGGGKAGSHLRATPTKLSQNPLLPASANLLVPSYTARIAIAAVITSAACTAIFTAVVLFYFPPRSRVACTCRIQFRHFRLFCLSAPGVRRFPYVSRSGVSPPLVSCSAEPVRAQLFRAAQGQTQSSLAPRSPLPSPLLNLLPPSGEGAATSKAIIDAWPTCIATNHYALMFPVV
jgi:hypothetical protein